MENKEMEILDKTLMKKIEKVIAVMKDKRITSCFINIKKNKNGMVEDITITNTKKL